MRNEKECSNTISLENRQINESKFYDECKNANYLFITSQTLYEIFWQSIKKTKKIDQFAYYYDQIIKFKNKYNVKFSILNDTDGEFELRLFEDQYKDNKVDINHFIERKREYEVKKINELLKRRNPQTVVIVPVRGFLSFVPFLAFDLARYRTYDAPCFAAKVVLRCLRFLAHFLF